LSAATVFLLSNPKKTAETLHATHSTTSFQTIAPGSEKAILTLSDGSQLVLDDSANGVLATQGSAQIVKNEEGEISYAGIKNEKSAELFNSMQTPRGGHYRLVLPDGTKVWLNASSSIRYPVAFNQQERRVEISGEVYFEVAHDKAHPFIVNTGSSSVHVLGTSFNINSYADEPWQTTTLVEGSIRMEKNNQFSLLRPGQQARIKPNSSIDILEVQDIEEVTAWKNGVFLFNSRDVQSIMRQISRWYDVEIVYQGSFSKETFSGIVSKSSSIEQVLKILEASGVHFKLDGKKLIVIQ
ncbi:FecR family protein, partial [Flavihumibacter sp. CACIAM 22H1]|uniref:FecR family protein n=1 Tax=Flavihumibacter sp. CACIAM 22H1 TaxID=1812911 RepID=UPI000AC57741